MFIADRRSFLQNLSALVLVANADDSVGRWIVVCNIINDGWIGRLCKLLISRYKYGTTLMPLTRRATLLGLCAILSVICTCRCLQYCSYLLNPFDDVQVVHLQHRFRLCLRTSLAEGAGMDSSSSRISFTKRWQDLSQVAQKPRRSR